MGGVHGTDFGDRHSVLPGRLVFRHSVQNLSTFASQTTASFRLVRLSEIGDYSKMVRSRWPSMLILAALSSTASAQSGEDPSRNACREDAQKLAPSLTVAKAALEVASMTKRTSSVRLAGKRSDYLKVLRTLGRV